MGEKPRIVRLSNAVVTGEFQLHHAPFCQAADTIGSAPPTSVPLTSDVNDALIVDTKVSITWKNAWKNPTASLCERALFGKDCPLM